MIRFILLEVQEANWMNASWTLTNATRRFSCFSHVKKNSVNLLTYATIIIVCRVLKGNTVFLFSLLAKHQWKNQSEIATQPSLDSGLKLTRGSRLDPTFMDSRPATLWNVCSTCSKSAFVWATLCAVGETLKSPIVWVNLTWPGWLSWGIVSGKWPQPGGGATRGVGVWGRGAVLLCVALGENNLRTERQKKSVYTHLMRRNTTFVPLLANEMLFIRQWRNATIVAGQAVWGSLSDAVGRRGSSLCKDLHVVCRRICSCEPLKAV